MAKTNIRSMKERTFKNIPVSEIDVINPRGRGKKQFEENVRSIADNGLYKPIIVHGRDYAKTGRYRLVCGQGRVEAHRSLNRKTIRAEIVHVEEGIAHLMSLAENITKSPPAAVEFAYAILDMKERGTSIEEIMRITGQPKNYVYRYINLVKRGEERLIRGVERGLFSLDFAMRVAESPDSSVQHILMDAYDKKMLNCKQVELVRRIIVERSRYGKKLNRNRTATTDKAYTLKQLQNDITRITRDKERFVHQAEIKETRLIRMLSAVRRQRDDQAFLELLRTHKLDTTPKLQGSYAV